QAQREEGLEETQVHLIHANRVEGTHVEGAHFDVFDATAQQRPGRPLARARDALRADAAVELVLDLQQIGVELAPLVADLDADRLSTRTAVTVWGARAGVRAGTPRGCSPTPSGAPACGCDSRDRSCAAWSHTARRPCRARVAAASRRARAGRNCTPRARCRTGTARASHGGGNCAAGRNRPPSARPSRPRTGAARRRGPRTRSEERR